MLCVPVGQGLPITLISDGPVTSSLCSPPAQGAPLTLASPLRQTYSAAVPQFHVLRNYDLFSAPTEAYYPW